MKTIDQFLADIAEYCRRNDVAESAFGRQALNDPNFVSDVKNGRSPTNALMERVYKFMRSKK